MKLLFTTLLCLLLTGCSASGGYGAAPEQVPELPRETANSLQNRYGNAVEAVSLPSADIQQLWITEAGLLLRSGKELMLLDESFQTAALCTLDFVPQITVSGQTISAFDPESRQLLLLSHSLEEHRRIILPSELSGAPFVRCDGSAVFYCTDRGIYCWDLSSGIRRRIRESVNSDQQLVGLHREDSVLQCRVEDRDLFLDTQSGQLLLEMTTPVQLTTANGHYYCIFSSGAIKNLVFGSTPDNPQALFPAASPSDAVFLPGIHAAVTIQATSGDTYRLDCYTLENGCLQSSLTLHHNPKAIVDHDGSITLLVRENGHDALLKWTPGNGSADGKTYTDGYFTADHPDHAGLTLCREYARSLSASYGLEILIWKDAAATQPWDYSFRPEHRYPVLLSQLQTLESCLSRYPQEVLAQTAANFDSLKLCLVQSVNGIAEEDSLNTATGVQFLNGSDAHVVLASGPYLEQALYHELFHVMEIHILSTSSALDRWNELNPAGFSYDLDHSTNAQRNSGAYLENDTRAFVDTYSMSFPKEDRARIFEYAMLPDMAHLFRSEIMQNKLSAVCSGIREAYALKAYPEDLPWEQYLQ